MTTTALALIDAQDAPAAQTTMYTSTSLVTIIDKFTAQNHSGAAVTLAVHLVPSGGTAGTANRIANPTIQAGKSYTFPELVGHTLNASDFISVLASAATSVNLRASGRQVS